MAGESRADGRRQSDGILRVNGRRRNDDGRRSRLLRLAATLSATMLFATACASGMSAGGAAGATSGQGDTLNVMTSFYPLQFVAQQVCGDRCHVTNLTPPAADPHNLELSLAAARALGQADLVVTLAGFQPAVDAAIATQNPPRVVDAAQVVTLLPATVTGGHSHDDDGHGHTADDGHDHTDDDLGAEYDHADDDGHDHADDYLGAEYDHADADHGHVHDIGGFDPHFWLDPTKLAQLAFPVAEALSEADPANTPTFNANATLLTQRLTELDQEFATQLAPFRGAKMVTSHTAFGYLAARYGLEQVGITGIDHDIEASPARLREIREIIADNNVQTIFYESLANPAVIQTLASDVGVNAAEIHTLEGLTTPELNAGEDYFTVMARNLATLVANLNVPTR